MKSVHNQDRCSVEGRPPVNLSIYGTFCLCELDLDQMTLSYELNTVILRMYQHTKIKIKFLGRL